MTSQGWKAGPMCGKGEGSQEKVGEYQKQRNTQLSTRRQGVFEVSLKSSSCNFVFEYDKHYRIQLIRLWFILIKTLHLYLYLLIVCLFNCLFGVRMYVWPSSHKY